MPSYLSGTAPARTTGSLGLTKLISQKVYSPEYRILHDEWNRLCDIVIPMWQTIGVAGSMDTNSHEYRLDAHDVDIAANAADIATNAADITALENLVGDGGYPPVFGDADEGNVRAYLNYYLAGLSRNGFIEQFTIETANLDSPGVSLDMRDSGTALSHTLTASPDGYAVQVGKCALNAGVATSGWATSANRFLGRSSYFAARLQIDALPTADTDYFQIGIESAFNKYVRFSSTRAGGAWPNWTVEVNDTGSTWSDVLVTGNPADMVGVWCTFEFVTTDTGAYFFYNRLKASHEEFGPGTQAPAADTHKYWIEWYSSGGSPSMYMSTAALIDQRDLWGL